MQRGYNCSMLIVALFATHCSAQQDWPRFRGPDGAGDGQASKIPVAWSDEDYNWRIKLPGVGHASPVVWGDRLYVMCSDPPSATRMLVCLRTHDGGLLWQRDFTSQPYAQHPSNGFATATPAADAHGVVVTWTTPDAVLLMALDLEGKTSWKRDLGAFVGPHGSGTSPIIHDDLVVLANDQEDMQLLARIIGREDPGAPVGKSFTIAVDRLTGEDRWRLERRTALASYSTPCVRRRADGSSELIFSSTAHGITAIDPQTGRVNWELPDLFDDRCVASPVVAGEFVLASYGHGTQGVLCVAARPGTVDPASPASVAYEIKKAVPLVPTPVVKNGRLFLWADNGVVTCLKIDTGEVVWQQRVGGNYFSSPVCTGDRIYCLDKAGTVVVIAAADEFRLLGRVALGEPAFATPAVADGVMYLRTESQLFSLGRQQR